MKTPPKFEGYSEPQARPEPRACLWCGHAARSHGHFGECAVSGCECGGYIDPVERPPKASESTR